MGKLISWILNKINQLIMKLIYIKNKTKNAGRVSTKHNVKSLKIMFESIKSFVPVNLVS